MRVLIAGAGSVGRAIAADLLDHSHAVTVMDPSPTAMRISEVTGAQWVLADACELTSLAAADADSMDVVVAATGDDKANLVISLLAKTEFAVPRTVARVNNARNEWLFDAQWGVDVAVSTPRIMAAMVEEAVTVGDLVKVFELHQSGASITEVTLPADAPLIGAMVGEIAWPPDTVLTCIVRADRTIAPSRQDTLEAGDGLLFVMSAEADPQTLAEVLRSAPPPT